MRTFTTEEMSGVSCPVKGNKLSKRWVRPDNFLWEWAGLNSTSLVNQLGQKALAEIQSAIITPLGSYLRFCLKMG